MGGEGDAAANAGSAVGAAADATLPAADVRSAA
jgi:hypothetical protein